PRRRSCDAEPRVARLSQRRGRRAPVRRRARDRDLPGHLGSAAHGHCRARARGIGRVTDSAIGMILAAETLMDTDFYNSRLRYLDADDIDDSIVDFDGLDVRGADGSKLGDLDGFVLESTSGRVFYAVVDSGGWFT